MAKVIIGIHGLDNKPAKEILERWWIKSIKEGLRRLHKRIKFPVFELVYWADVVHDKPLNPAIRNKNKRGYIEERYTKAPKGFRHANNTIRIRLIPYIIKYLKKIILNKDFSLKYPKLTTTIVDRYFHDLDIYYKGTEKNDQNKHYAVKRAIIEKVVQVLKKYKNDDILLIGHSMGSIIAFDVISNETPDIKIHTFISIGSALGQPFVMSKIAANQNIKQNGEIKLNTPTAIVDKWYNFSDIEDIIAINYKLSDEFSENDSGVKPIDSLVVNDYIVKNKRNPHKSFGYLRTKEVAEIIAAFINEKRPNLVHKTLSTFKNLYGKTKSTVKEQIARTIKE